MTDEQPPIAPAPPSLEPPPPPSHGPFAFPPPPEPGPGPSGWSPVPDQQGWQQRPQAFFPLDIGRVFELTFSLYRSRWRTLVAISLPLEVVLAIASLALFANSQLTLLTDLSSGPPTAAELQAFLNSLAPAIALGLAFAVIFIVVGFIQFGAMTDALARVYAGRPAGAVNSLSHAGRRLTTWVALMLLLLLGIAGTYLVGALIGILTLLLIVTLLKSTGLALFLTLVVMVGVIAAVIFVGVRWSMVVQVAMVERVGAVEAMRRSWHVIAGSMWRVIGYYLAFWLLVAVLSAIIGTFTNVLINPYTMSGFRIVAVDYTKLAISTVLSSILGAFVAPLTAIPAFLLYLDLRFRRGEHINPPSQGSLMPTTGASVTEEQL